jgi:hypothetical protein
MASFERFAFFTGLSGGGPISGLTISGGEFVQQLLVVGSNLSNSPLTFGGPIELVIPFVAPTGTTFYINPNGSVYQLDNVDSLNGIQFMAVIFK